MGLAFVAVSHGAESARAVKLRFGGDESETRVVLELGQAAEAQVTGGGAAGPRLALSFAGLKLGGALNGEGRGIVRAWRLEEGGGKAQLSLDLKAPGRIRRRFLLPPGDGSPAYRYVLDIDAIGARTPDPQVQQAQEPPIRRQPVLPDPLQVSDDGEADRAPPVRLMPLTPADISATFAAQAGAPPEGAVDAPPVRAPRRGAKAAEPFRKRVIVIDAGHGGHDPGALGSRSREKDVTLAAAKALRARLERGGRYKVVMTRDGDVYIPLESRVTIARTAGADLFISLHADSGGDPKVRGATAYTLSDHGVDRATRSIFSGGFINVQLPGRDLSVKQILLDLTQRTTRNRSGAFAETLLEHISNRTPLLRRSHRDAGYMVLLAPDVPAVLLEMGFITNPGDEAGLSDPRRRARLMDSVGDAIDAYFADIATKPAAQ
jgi:N-acetylmuramoyl-L-alanine amidase